VHEGHAHDKHAGHIVALFRDGEIILVRPGARVPADGLVRSGQSTVPTALPVTAMLRDRLRGDTAQV
jgi:hypothetical protein